MSINIKNQKAKRYIKKVPKVGEKKVFKVSIESRMVTSLQLRELGMQNTTAWFGQLQYVIQLFTEFISVQTKAHY